MLIEELYSKERGRRVEFFGIQLDEMRTFVQNKKNKQWLWLALNPANRQIIAFHVGGRSGKDAQLFCEKIPAAFKQRVGFSQTIGRLMWKHLRMSSILALEKTAA